MNSTSNQLLQALEPYEDISSSDPGAARVNAEKAICEGWTRRGYPAIDLANIDWAMHDDSQRSWNFLVHCWDMLDSQLKAFQQTFDVKYLKVAINVALSWADFIADDSKAHKSMAWYDMAVGLRSYRLAYILDACRKIQELECFSDSLTALLKLHHGYLKNEENIVFHNNHGLYQVAGQIAMGRRFCDVDQDMADALTQGKERLRVIVSRQFADDGTHLEHSPDYHRMVYETLKALIQSGLVEDEDIVGKAVRIEEALAWFITPDLHIANFGDSDFRLMARKPKKAKQKWLTELMQYTVTDGEIGRPTQEDYKVFDKGGYFVVKAPAVTDKAKTGYLIQNAGYHSRTHKHADDLTFIWSEGTQNIVIDAGRFGYLGKTQQNSELWKDGFWYSDPNRIYVESTRAHNCLEFDDANIPRRGRGAYGSAIQRSGRFAENIYVVETELRIFKSIRQQRVLIYRPGQWLIVFDWFKDNYDKPHNVKQWLQIDPSLSVRKQEDCFVCENSDINVQVATIASAELQSESVIGSKDPTMQGWFSPAEREMIPCYSISNEVRQQSEGHIVSLLSVSNSLRFAPKRQKVAKSGNMFQFEWQDEFSVHRLNVDRQRDMDLKVEYICD